MINFPEQYKKHVPAMKNWLKDCDMLPWMVDELTDNQTLSAVHRMYDGGILGFILDATTLTPDLYNSMRNFCKGNNIDGKVLLDFSERNPEAAEIKRAIQDNYNGGLDAYIENFNLGFH